GLPHDWIPLGAWLARSRFETRTGRRNTLFPPVPILGAAGFPALPKVGRPAPAAGEGCRGLEIGMSRRKTRGPGSTIRAWVEKDSGFGPGVNRVSCCPGTIPRHPLRHAARDTSSDRNRGRGLAKNGARGGTACPGTLWSEAGRPERLSVDDE